MRGFVILIILLSVSKVEANIELSKQKAKEIASGLLNGTIKKTTTEDIESNKKLKEGLNYQGTDGAQLPQKNMSSGQIENEALIARKDSAQGDLVEGAFYKREDYDIGALSRTLDRSREVQKNPEKHIDFLSGSKECDELQSEDITAKAKYVCDEYVSWEDNSCKVGQVVEVDAKHRYQCEIRREKREGTCDKVLKAWCEGDVRDCGYNSGGIIKGSVASDMKFVYDYPYLTIGTIADNYWSGDCQEYSRNTTLTIKDLNKIKKFRIKEVGFDDHMMIKINGHVVHVGPFGGSELSRSWSNKYRAMPREWHWAVWTGREDHYCELGVSRRYNVDIDIKPYLREGENTIYIKVFVGGHGEGWMKIEVSQYCCEVKERWGDECEKLKA